MERLDVAPAVAELSARAPNRMSGQRPEPPPPLRALVPPPEPAWALVAAATMAITAIATAQRAIRSGRRSGRS